jgi:hypothetical protein
MSSRRPTKLSAASRSGGRLASESTKGARPTPRHKRQTTTHITERQAKNLLEAFHFADALGLRLNVAIDIRTMFAGFTDDQKRLARCQERLSKWCARHGFPLTWIWVREMGRRGGRNTHVLMHIPPWLMERDDFRFAFEAELKASLRPEGEPTHEKAIFVKAADYPIGKLESDRQA